MSSAAIRLMRPMFALLGAQARFALFATVCAALPAVGQSVQWQLPDSGISEGRQTGVRLVYENCEPQAGGAPQPPAVDGLQFTGAVSHGSETQVINGRFTHRSIFNYGVMATRTGRITIPAMQVNTSAGVLTVAAVTFEVGQSMIAGQPANEAALHILRTEKPTVWAGEVFNLESAILVPEGVAARMASDREWDHAPLLLESWSEGESVHTLNPPRKGMRHQTRAIAPAPGTLQLPPASVVLEIERGRSAFDLFMRPQVDRLVIKTDPLQLNVRPLPQPPPPGFDKAVGQFSLSSKVVPTEVRVGDPITWTLELSGTGNFPAGLSLPPRDVAQSLTVALAPKPRMDAEINRPFNATITEEAVLVPTDSGTVALGPVAFVFFNPDSGRYEEATAAAVQVKVNPAPSSAAAPAPPSSSSAAAPSGISLTRSPEAPALALAPSNLLQNIPQPPIPGSGSALTPQGDGFARALALPLICVFLAWIGLALHTWTANDPVRPRRAARRRALALVNEIESAQSSGALPLDSLLAWQQECSQFLALPPGVHSAKAVSHVANQNGSPIARSLWSDVWFQAETALFSPARQLPAEWARQARDAMDAIPLRHRPFATFFEKRNILPALAAALLLVQPARANAPAQPIEDYNAGRFQAALAAWSAQLAAQPADWIARNNAALSLAQLDRWKESAAHAAAARALHPRHPSVRWNWDLAADRAGWLRGDATEILPRDTNTESSPAPRRSRYAAIQAMISAAALYAPALSAAEWQLVGLLATTLIACGFLLALVRRYGFVQRPVLLPVLLLVACGALFGLASSSALAYYGPLAHPDAAVLFQTVDLRSTPTDAESKGTRIQPGTLVIPVKRFLGWTQVELATSQSGWVRSKELIYLYRGNPL